MQLVERDSFNFMGLPLDLQDNIFNRLSINDLKIASRVSIHFKALSCSARVSYFGLTLKYLDAREMAKNREISLFLRSKELINAEVLEEAAKQWPNTSQLEIIKTDTNEIQFSEGFLQKIAALFPKLTGLSLQSRSFDDFEAFSAIRSEDLMGFSDKMPNLSSLALMDCTSISSEAYVYTIRRCSKLSMISLKGNQVTDPVVIEAMTRLPHLDQAEFYAANISKNGVSAIAESQTKITDLLLHIEFSEEGQAEDRDISNAITHQRRLKKIDLRSTEIGPLTTRALSRLPNLQESTLRD